MACKKQRTMVLHQKGSTTWSAAVSACCPPASFEAVRAGKTSKREMEDANRTSGGLKVPAKSNLQSASLPPESVCDGIRVTLENNSMWKEFFLCGTEMILTKHGNRMFPYCRFRISGLQPSKKYCLIVDIQPLDGNRYKWTGKSWHICGKALPQIKSHPFVHPESPAAGHHWMASPVSFYRLKLTNSLSAEDGNIVLHPMQRYVPRLHIVQTDEAARGLKLNDPSVVTFTFPQTEFMAVTAYQNSQFSQLKVDYNPFSKGLKEDRSTAVGQKLKTNSEKNELHKNGVTALMEQHPVRKSLKSLLQNHKPRNSKILAPKLSAQEDQKNSAVDKDESAAVALGDNSCTISHPGQKLFSELIREAHVSLQRCNLEQLGIKHNSPITVQQLNTKTTAGKDRGPTGVQKEDAAICGTPKKTETVLTQRKGCNKEVKIQLNSLEVRTEYSAVTEVSKNTSNNSEQLEKMVDGSAVSPPLQRRPARLPLPALALFLKRHSMKSKMTKSKPELQPSEVTSESLSDTPRCAVASASSDLCVGETGTSKNLGADGKDVGGDITKFSQAAGQEVLNIAEQIVDAASHPSCPEPVEQGTNNHLTFISRSSSPEPTVFDGTSGLNNLDHPFCISKEYGSALSPTAATSSESLTLPQCIDIVLPSSNHPQTFECPSLLSQSSTLKSSLPDPECSSFGFEPLSPASTPESLPPLPASIALALDSTPADEVGISESPEDFPLHKDTSVFKWHTVLPPSETYVESSFTTFQPSLHALPLASVTTPLLPSQTPSLTEAHSTNTTSSMTDPDPPPSFPDHEHSLPFPTELSPLAIQLPLSPTFSSLEGDGLSPTPSLVDLVQFFSTDADLGMGVEFSNTEAVTAPCPTQQAPEEHEPSQQVQLAKGSKHRKSRKRKLGQPDMFQELSMQPNLEEVEEQLFISFTSKEALKLHTEEGPVPAPQMMHRDQETADKPQNYHHLEETIIEFQKVLLKDLKLMKHRQVIHPVLQEVGLKMTLLDPTLAIDLQYLGVRLPIPPPGIHVEPPAQDLPSSQGVSAEFVSRTGKTTDVTKIKGWREKFTPSSEATSTSCPVSRPEAVPAPEQQKKNLSAFCSDMLDEYLENEGKLIDERAASFSQQVEEPLIYELPTKSTSYVRTLDHVLKKQTTTSPASDLISGFVPPSKRPRLKETKASRRVEKNQKMYKNIKVRPELKTAQPPEPGPPESQQPVVPPSDPAAEPLPTIKRKRRFKPSNSSHTLSSSRSSATSPARLKDLAPLESDSELGCDGGQGNDISRRARRPLMTRALLKQRDLEDRAAAEGHPRTWVTEERAAVALTTLFTQTGFASENPTAPIQLAYKKVPPCRNAFCRLGCICSSLSYCSKISHCGRPPCMFSCGCLKQKVVILKNLDGSDSSPSCHHGNKKKKRRMKMAYILKEADGVSQPAKRVRILWKRNNVCLDEEPVYSPASVPDSVPLAGRKKHSSCARAQEFIGKARKFKQLPKDLKGKKSMLKRLKKRKTRLKKTKTRSLRPPPAGEAHHPPPPSTPPPSFSPPSETPPSPSSPPKPSKRLVILAEVMWASDGDRNHVLKKLCEAMAQDRLDGKFWIRKYLISPISQRVDGGVNGCCIEYRVHISRPAAMWEKSEPPVTLKEANGEKKSRNEMKVKVEEMDPEIKMDSPRDWLEETENAMVQKEDGGRNGGVEQTTLQEVKKRKVLAAMPFLTGVSPAGFLSASKKQPGESDHLIQVNGKLYPRAKIQLGRMGALHPANRLAAYLMGRVVSSRQVRALPPPTLSPLRGSVLSSKPCPQLTSSGPSNLSVAVAATTSTTTRTSKPKKKQKPTTANALTTVRDPPPSSSVPPHLNPSPTTAKTLTPVREPPSSSSVPPHPAPSPTTAKTLITVRDPTPSSSVPPHLNPSRTTAKTLVTVRENKQNCISRSLKREKKQGSSPLSSLGPPHLNRSPTTAKTLTTVRGPTPNSPVSPHLNKSPTTAVNPPQVILIQVPGSLKTNPLTLVTPQPPTPLTPTSQKMVLQSVQTVSGVQLYRRPDGKLVQLVPISQLRAVPAASQTTAPSSSMVLSTTPCQTAPITVVQQQPPPPLPASSLVRTPHTTPALSGSCLIAQKGTCTFKILPAASSKPTVIACEKAPLLPKVVTTVLQAPPTAPGSVFSVKPLKTGGAKEGEVSTPTSSTVCLGPGRVVVNQKPAPTNPSPTEIRPVTPAGSEVIPTTPKYSPKPELARDLVDLDIICVEPPLKNPTKPEPAHDLDQDIICVDPPLKVPSKTELARDVVDLDVVWVDDETRLMEMEPIDVEELVSSSETENSSDFRESDSDDYDDDDEAEKEGGESVLKSRLLHNASERLRRMKMRQLFEGLRIQVAAKNNSKVFTLKKAVEVIREVRAREFQLRKKKRRLKRRRDEFLRTISGFADQTEPDPVKMPQRSHTGETTVILHEKDQIQSVQNDRKERKIQKISLIQQKVLISSSSDEDKETIRRRLSSRPTEMHQGANQLPHAETGASVPQSAGGATSSGQQLTTQAPPTSVSALSTPTPVPTLQPQSEEQPVLTKTAVPHSPTATVARPKTIPNILCRSKLQRMFSPEGPTKSEAVLPTDPSGESPYVSVSPDIVSVATMALPCQPTLSLNPSMMLQQTTPPPGVASVTLTPMVTNHQIQIGSLSLAPTAPSSSMVLSTVPHQTPPIAGVQHQTPPPPSLVRTPLTTPSLSGSGLVAQQGSNVTNQLQLIALPSPQIQAQLPPGPLPMMASAGSESSSDPGWDQDQPSTQTKVRPASTESTAPCPTEKSPQPEAESLTSLLKEIVFLNQQNGTVPPSLQKADISGPGGPKEYGPAHGPELVRFGSDSDNTEVITEITQTAVQQTPEDGKVHVLAPPPLLQMKLNSAVNSDCSSEGTTEGRTEAGQVWRPMPRLVPLGLRGNQPS
ncbi:MAX dimerization protein MGA a [Pholidichthys leucotaenia]